jgi:hypothetical protein
MDGFFIGKPGNFASMTLSQQADHLHLVSSNCRLYHRTKLRVICAAPHKKAAAPRIDKSGGAKPQ